MTYSIAQYCKLPYHSNIVVTYTSCGPKVQFKLEEHLWTEKSLSMGEC